MWYCSTKDKFQRETAFLKETSDKGGNSHYKRKLLIKEETAFLGKQPF
jgi:hypothetical protein